jgi:hypothetical protein
MNTVNVLLTIGIIFIAYLIRKEMRHGDALDKQSKDDQEESSRSLA